MKRFLLAFLAVYLICVSVFMPNIVMADEEDHNAAEETSLVSQEANMPVKLYEKITDFHFNIRGFMFRSDAVLIMDRPISGFRLLIFAFVSSNGANGLDQRVKQLLVPNLYKLMASNLKNLLDQVYNRVGDNYDIGELQEIPEDK